MAIYEIWKSNVTTAWTTLHLETDDIEEARRSAEAVQNRGEFRFVAIDKYGKTIWTNDPDTDVELE